MHEPTGRNRVCPWRTLDGDGPWTGILVRDGTDRTITDGDLARSRHDREAIRAHRMELADLDIADRLARLSEEEYERHRADIASFFGWFREGYEPAGKQWLPLYSDRPLQHPERFPLLSEAELHRGLWSFRETEHLPDSQRFVPFHQRWGPSLRDQVLGALRRGVARGAHSGDELARVRAEIKLLEAGYWPVRLMHDGWEGPGTYRHAGSEPLNVLAQPWQGAPVTGTVRPGDLVNHAGQVAGPFVKLINHLGWVQEAWLAPAPPPPIE